MRLTVACFIALAALVALSCSDSESNDLEEYFNRFRLSPDLERRMQASEDQYNSAIEGAPDEVKVQKTREFLRRSAPIVRELAASLAEIDPPEVVAAAHEELIDATEGMARAMLDADAELANIRTTREAQQVAFPLILDAQARLNSACRTLMAIAEGEGITPSASASCGLSPLEPNVSVGASSRV